MTLFRKKRTLTRLSAVLALVLAPVLIGVGMSSLCLSGDVCAMSCPACPTSSATADLTVQSSATCCVDDGAMAAGDVPVSVITAPVPTPLPDRTAAVSPAADPAFHPALQTIVSTSPISVLHSDHAVTTTVLRL